MKKMSLSLLIILSGIMITACNLETANNTNEEPTKVKQSENTAVKEKTETKKKEDSKNNYMDALRKCTVMEAADIYTTGVGKKSDNAFNDARETCENFYEQWGEKDFIDVQNEDWENRKDEIIEDKPLSHYLDILGW